MRIETLKIKNCRLLHNVSLELSPHLNIIIGKNASGKTSLLESLSLLSTGKSFRTIHISELISHSKKEVLVSSHIIKPSGESSHIGIQKSAKQTKIRIDKKDIYSQAELSVHLPVTIIHPDSINLITGSPNIRRSYLDWIIFYRHPDFHKTWKEYRHVLKQRNSCLKDPQHYYALDQWTEALVKLQPVINNFRLAALDKLCPILNEITYQLLGVKNISLSLHTGFPHQLTLEKNKLLDFYKEREAYDKKIHRTSSGVHSADIKITINDKPAKESASRGQLKLLTIALLLAQSKAIQKADDTGLILIDDLASELDKKNKKILLQYLSHLNQQLIITSTNKLKLNNIKHKVFHVKHGEVIESL